MKIKRIDSLYGSLKSIPKTSLESINVHDIQENVSSLIEHSSLINGDEISIGESLLQNAEHVSHGIPVISLITRIGAPLKDLLNGNIDAAIKRTAINIVDVALYQARFVYGGLGAIRGLIVKMRGADTPDAGFLKGYLYAIRNWGDGRRSVEKAVISPWQFIADLRNDPLKEKYERYGTERDKYLNKQKGAILQNSEKTKIEIENWGNANIERLESSRKELDQMISIESSMAQAYQQNFTNYEFDNNELIGKLEALKILQHNLYTDCKRFADDIKAMVTSIPNQSEKNKILSEIADVSSQYYQEEIDNIEKSILFVNKILKFNEILFRKTSQRGFNRIAGYENIKNFLNQKFVCPIKYIGTDKKQSIPNMILFYGPKGCGKTLFANALADETNCNVIKLELTLDFNNDFKNLQNAIKEAKNTYEIKGKHSIIHIDEIDGFLSDQTYKSNETKDLIQSLSNNYCTIVATTNYPEKVNNSIISGPNIENIYIGPPDKTNIQEVLKYYIEDFTNSNINYQHLTNILQEKTNNFFSNAKIAESILYALKETLLEIDNIYNQKYFENILKRIDPDITKASIQNYK